MCQVEVEGGSKVAAIQREIYEDHVKDLALKLGVKLDWFNTLHGMMFVEEEPMRVEIPVLYHHSGAELEKRYLVCLHELGHCFHGHTQGRPLQHQTGKCPRVMQGLPCSYCNVDGEQAVTTDKEWRDRHKFYFENGVLRSEAQAWEWALDEMLRYEDDLQSETYRFMSKECLGSYFTGYVHAGGKESKLWNGNRHHVSFVYDEPDDYFFGVMRRLEGGVRAD